MIVRLSKADVAWIRLFAAETQATVKMLSEEFKVRPRVIRKVIRGETYKDVT